MDPSLKLNRETGRYELVVTITVDAEIFRRMLYRYAEENHIDPTDLAAWQQAIETVTRAERWLAHPHADVQTGKQPAPEPLMLSLAPDDGMEALRKLAREMDELRALARTTPEAAWPSLMTPIPDNLSTKERRPYYQRRHREYHVFDQVRREREAAAPDLERLQILAEATNGARLK